MDTPAIIFAFIGIVGTLIVFLLSLLLSDTREIKREVKAKVDKVDCDKAKTKFEGMDDDLWTALNAHGHSQNGRVTRGKV